MEQCSIQEQIRQLILSTLKRLEMKRLTALLQGGTGVSLLATEAHR